MKFSKPKNTKELLKITFNYLKSVKFLPPLEEPYALLTHLLIHAKKIAQYYHDKTLENEIDKIDKLIRYFRIMSYEEIETEHSENFKKMQNAIMAKDYPLIPVFSDFIKNMKSNPRKNNPVKLDKMTMSYLETGLWSTADYDSGDDSGNDMLDASYGTSDISDKFKRKAQEECEEFYEKISHLLSDEDRDNSLEHLGHDFWLTRNRHGAGFWDGDYENGDEITKIVNKFYPENDDELNDSIERV